MTRDNRAALLDPALLDAADKAGAALVAERLAMVTAERRRQALAEGAPVWPRNRFADYFPAVREPAPLVAVTVFVERVARNAAGRFYSITCVCGDQFVDENRQHARKQVGAHRCDEVLGHPAGPLPARLPLAPVDEDLLTRVLDRLRAL